MQIEQIRIQGIGPFQEEHTFFVGGGCTLFNGGNETGKTSLARAIFGAFYGFTTRLVEDPDADPSWVEITFEQTGQNYVLYREANTNRVTLTEITNTEEAILFEGSTQNSDEAEAYRTRLALILGDGEGVVWSRSGFVTDGEVPTLLDDTVQRWLAGQRSNEGEVALSRLERRLAEARGADEDPDTGHWQREKSELEKKREALELWSVNARSLVETREALELSRAELGDLPEETGEEDAEYLETLERFEALTRDRGRLEEEVVSLQEEKGNIDQGFDEAKEARARLEQDYADMLRFPEDIEPLIAKWTATLDRRKEIEKSIEAMDSAPEAPEPRTRSGGVPISLGLGSLVTLLCYGAGAPNLGLVLGPVTLALGIVFFWAQGRNATQLSVALEEERVRLAAELDDVDRKIQKIKDRVRDLGDFETPASLRRQFRGFLVAQEKVEHVRGSAESQRSLSEIEDDNERILKELKVVDAKIREMVAEASYLAGMDAKQEALAEELERARRKQKDSGNGRKNVIEQVEELEAAIEGLESELPEPGRLLTEIAQLERQVVEDQYQRQALELAVSALGRVMEDRPVENTEHVFVRASEFFRKLSLDRYQGLRLDGDLEPEVQSEGHWISGHDLSRRTRDQLWLALRLAAHEEAGKRALPLVLDEPFLGWDDQRLEIAQGIVKELIEAGRQIVLFSADARLKEWTQTILQLRLSNGTSGEFERQAA